MLADNNENSDINI